MFRRDQFLDLLGKYNSLSSIDNAMIDLETYIDSKLMLIDNVISLINNTNATTKPLENGLEIVDTLKITNIVHRDITVISDNEVIAGTNTEVVSYSIWNDDLLYPNNTSATITPWIDKTIAETLVQTFIFNGRIKIQCPPNTNKFVALSLANKYMSIGEIDSSSNLISGYWSMANRANDKNNLPNSANEIVDSVRVLFDSVNNIVYMEFRLY